VAAIFVGPRIRWLLTFVGACWPCETLQQEQEGLPTIL